MDQQFGNGMRRNQEETEKDLMEESRNGMEKNQKGTGKEPMEGTGMDFLEETQNGRVR